jgi:cytochrome c-type biogenesis protein CcmE
VSRGRVIVVLVIIVASLGWIAAKSLSGNLIYYLTPTELLAKGTVGERVRLGGLVEPGSVQHEGQSVRFVVTDGQTRMTVVDTGGVPSLFREGQGVVVEGVYGQDGAFHADTVLVKHSGVYRPPSPGEKPAYQGP